MNRSRTILTAGAVIALCGSASVVVAQDSVGVSSGVNGAIAGDAVTSHDLNTQCAQFVVDLGTLTSSWNNTWGVAPIAKSSSANDPAFFNMLMSNQSIAQTTRLGVDRSGDSYDDWSTAGPGINHFGNPAKNSIPPYSVGGPASAAQQAYVFSEFGGPSQAQNSNVIAGMINWDPQDNPGRLFVTRTEAAVANQTLNGGGSSTFGVGMIDSDGNAMFRADAFNLTGSNLISGQNVYRVSVEDRNCGQINWINSTTTGRDTGATDHLVNNDSANVLTPNMLAEQYATSGDGRLITTDYDTNYIWENPVNTAAFSAFAHLQGIDSTRGSMAVINHAFFPDSVGTGATLSIPTNGIAYGATTVVNSGDHLGISMWGVSGTGAVTQTMLPVMLPWGLATGPGSITDDAPSGINPNTSTNYTVTSVGTPVAEWGHVYGSTSFRGPTSQVGLGVDPSGKALVSAVLFNQPEGASSPGGNQGNTLCVARVDVSTNPPTYRWTAAAWNNYDQTFAGLEGKDVVDGPGSTNAIARLCPRQIVNDNSKVIGGANGPSITPAGFDSEGNIYFVSPVQIKRGADFDAFNPNSTIDAVPELIGTDPNPERDRFELALIRGVLTSTGSDFYYELELMLATHNEYYSPNTGLDYQISYIDVTTGSGGLTPGAFDGGDVNGDANPSGAPSSQDDPLTLGGMIIQVSITYDVDGLDTVTPANPNPDAGTGSLCTPPFYDNPVEIGGTGRYEDPSANDSCDQPLFPDSMDQSYHVLLYIGNEPSQLGACCINTTCVDSFSESQCTAAGGDYKGDGTLCASEECATLGACCFGCAGSTPVVCQNLTSDQCCAVDGLYAGDGTECASNPCQAICKGDLNGDGNCDVFDFSIFASNFGTPSGAGRCTGDLDCSGSVDVFDFSVFSSNFGCNGVVVPNQCCSQP